MGLQFVDGRSPSLVGVAGVYFILPAFICLPAFSYRGCFLTGVLFLGFSYRGLFVLTPEGYFVPEGYLLSVLPASFVLMERTPFYFYLLGSVGMMGSIICLSRDRARGGPFCP